MKKLISFLLLIISIGVNTQSFMMNPMVSKTLWRSMVNGKPLSIYTLMERKQIFLKT